MQNDISHITIGYFVLLSIVTINLNENFKINNNSFQIKQRNIMISFAMISITILYMITMMSLKMGLERRYIIFFFYLKAIIISLFYISFYSLKAAGISYPMSILSIIIILFFYYRIPKGTQYNNIRFLTIIYLIWVIYLFLLDTGDIVRDTGDIARDTGDTGDIVSN